MMRPQIGRTGGRRLSWGKCRWCGWILFYENQTREARDGPAYWCGFCKREDYTPAPPKEQKDQTTNKEG